MKKLFSIFVVIMIAMIFFINSNFAAEKLETPKDLKWSETEPGVLTWTPVEGADWYHVMEWRDGEVMGEGGTQEPKVNLKNHIEYYGLGTYKLEITATSNETSIMDSEPVTTTYVAKQLSKPENLKWSETEPGVLTWTPVKGASSYNVMQYRDGVVMGEGGTEEPKVNLKNHIESYGLGTYTLEITANCNGAYTMNSEPVTTTYEAKRISKPENLKWSEIEPGVLTWSPVKGAVAYNVMEYKDGMVMGEGVTENPKVDLRGHIRDYGLGTYKLEITAICNGAYTMNSETVTTSYTAKNEENSNQPTNNNDKKPSTSTNNNDDKTSSKPSTDKVNTNKNDKTTTSTTKKIEKIEITKAPIKTVYKAGESFDNIGMIVTATYSDGSTQEITDYKIADGENLELGQNRVLLHYTDGDREIEAIQEITVEEIEETEIIDTNTTGTDIVEKNDDNSSKAKISIIVGAVAFVVVVVIGAVIIVAINNVKKKNK